MGEILTNLEFSGYRTIPAVNWSLLKLHDHSPAHYRLAADAPPTPPTPACLLGQAVHALVLEGEAAYRDRFIVAPEGLGRRTKADKATWQELQDQAAGRDVLTADQAAAVLGMAEAIGRSRTANKLLARCTVRESTVIWTDPATGTPCKARPDAMDPASGLLVDLKSTADATLEAIRKDVARRLYHAQLAFYRRGIEATGHPAGPAVLLFVESTPPHGVRVVALDDEALQAGDNLVAQLLGLHADCERTGLWPGYADRVEAPGPAAMGDQGGGMRRRTREQEARLAELLAAGWTVAEELPLLGLVTLIRGTITDTGAVGAEYKTIGRNGHDLRGPHARR